MTKPHDARTTEEVDPSPSPLPFPGLPGPLEDLATTTNHLLKRVGLEPTELGAMFDALGSLFGGEQAEASLTLQPPVYALVPNDDNRWLVVRLDSGEDHVLANVVAKQTAATLARRRAREEGGTLVVHRSDGSVQSTYHYGMNEPDDEDPRPSGELVSLDAHRR